MLELLRKLLATNSFIPHGHCYLWKSELLSLHIVSDLLIALAYYSIPIALLYFIHQRRDVPFRWMFLLFGAFMISCGTSHVMEVWTLWHPNYWLSGFIKAIAAFMSCYTAVELVGLIPKALALPSSADLEAANQKLAAEISDRQQVEAALRHSEARFRSVFEGAAIGIALIDVNGRPVAMNPALSRMLGYSENECQQITSRTYNDLESLPTGWERYQELISGKRDSYQMEKRYLSKDGQMLERDDSYQMEKRYLSKDGQLLWCHITVSSVRDGEGKPQFGIRMVEDITKRKQAEVALRQYQEHLEELVGERTAHLQQANQQLSWQATHDQLTGLANRREFEKRLEEAVVDARMSKHTHALCYLDLDRFKIVNDTCGHVAGDELLRQVSTLLQNSVRKTDVLARLGGDEFALLLYNCPLESALRVAQQLQESINIFRFAWQEKPFSIGVSIGIVTINEQTTNVDKVLNDADAACYAAKNKGRNRVHLYEANDVDLTQQRLDMLWVARIERAIADDQFCLYYQPIAPLNANLATGFHYEVLLRLVDDNGELISPMAFLPTAERCNLMPSVDRWVISTFFTWLSDSSSGILRKPLNLKSIYAINLSGATVNDDQFIDFLKEQLSIHQIPTALICFEITETVAIANLGKAAGLIKDLKSLGCRFALDDFGSGMSSFAYLKSLPVDYLKIDGAFVKDIADDPIDFAMVEAFNRIGHVMGLQTIAEYVANDSILQKVRSLGVDYAQGYFIAKPKPILDFRA
jgi:diguanylate cyclase (GGDEF)-like protein/PAS domain S-box-containing protein